jgi:hypothetical protein
MHHIKHSCIRARTTASPRRQDVDIKFRYHAEGGVEDFKWTEMYLLVVSSSTAYGLGWYLTH